MSDNTILHKGQTIKDVDKIERLKPVYGNAVSVYCLDGSYREYDDPDGSLYAVLSDMLAQRHG
jgi:hypothetical protein